jgi:GMP synthase-like glutamine amidotransferase
MSHVVILQHQDDAPAGLLLDVLLAHGLVWETVRVDRGEVPPDPVAVQLVVSLGADAAAHDLETRWVHDEIAWLREADTVGTAILGLCFGAQALAIALGGTVAPARRPERGWIELQSEEPETLATGPWQSWHQDSISVLPPAADLIAHNSSGPQAFRHGAHLGLQFHPEVTPGIVDGWVRKHAARNDNLAELEAAACQPPGRFQQATANAYRLFHAQLSSLSLFPRSEQVIQR